MAPTPIALPRCGLTLDTFGRISVGACDLMGIEREGACKTFDCREREKVFGAVFDAQSLIEEVAKRKICGHLVTLKSQVDHFDLGCGWRPQTRREESVEFTVSVPETLAAPPCFTCITLVGTLVLQACEEIEDVRIEPGDCACVMLPPEWRLAQYEVLSTDPDTGARTVEITLVTRAFNLQFSDGLVDGTNLDWLPETADIVITISLPAREARVYWQPSTGCCPVQEPTCNVSGCCHLQLCCGCIREETHDTWKVLDWRRGCCVQKPCCDPFPHHFELDVWIPGEWQPGWAQAVLSLANNLLPNEWCHCDCNPAANARWQRDTATTDSFVVMNGFGIPTYGAKLAWSIVASEEAHVSTL